MAQAGGQHAPDQVPLQKIHAQGTGTGRIGQRHADVAVVDAGAVVVAGDHDGTADVPLAALADQARVFQPLLDGAIEPGDAPLSFAHGAQQAELLEGAQHRQRVAAQQFEIGPVALHRQLQQRRLLGVLDPCHFTATAQHPLGRRGVAVVDGQRQRADGAAEAVTVAQHDGLLGQRAGVATVLRRQRLAGRRQRVIGGGGIVAARLGVLAQVAQYRPRLHRRQLVLVAQQHQGGIERQRVEQRRHHFQVHHRGLVDDEDVDVERVGAVVGEVAGVGARAQQAVQGARGTDGLGPGAQVEAIRCTAYLGGQLLQRLVDRLFETGRRLAGGRRQGDAQGRLAGAGQQQRQQARHRVGLAGAGAAGDDGDVAAHGDGAGQALPVERKLRARFPRTFEQARQPAVHFAAVDRAAGAGARADGGRHQRLVAPVTAQVEPLAIEHQRLVVIEFVHLPDLPGRAQHRQPLLRIFRQRRGGRSQGRPLLRRPAHQGGGILGQLGHHQAAVAAPFQFGEQHAGQHQRRILGGHLADEAGEHARQAAQRAMRRQQGDLVPEPGHAATSMPSNASMASSSARSGAMVKQPWVEGWAIPRRNRKTAPPSWRSGA